VLDTQIEAQVHGPIDLHRDVELLVADPAFAATATGTILRQLALRYEIPLQWHAEALQHLTQLWHVLVHYGLPARSMRDPP
jgi:hypothetical protein